jgi:DNA-directed RNA polymerase subunit delta
MEKKRVIVDYKNITEDLLKLLTDTYPYGYEDFVVRFKNAKGENVQSIPLETDDTKYLVKVGIELDKVVEAFLDDDDDGDDDGGEKDLDVSDSEVDDSAD